MDTMVFHDMTFTWLDGGNTAMDGGAMFGVVPKPLWSRKYPFNDQNQIELLTDPILIQYKGKSYLIDSSVGNGKLTEKQKRNFGVWTEPKIEESLAKLNLSCEEIDAVLMTHMHFDHAGGLTMVKDGQLISRFPNAVIYTSEVEWEEMRHPNVRSKSSYWKENWEAIENQVITFKEHQIVTDGIEMVHTGGHSNGHSIIRLKQKGETVLHMADLMPTHAHQNPLWVLAYDDYPMTSVFAKEKLMKEAYQSTMKFIFYHDAHYRMVQWSSDGKEMIDSLKCSKEALIPWNLSEKRAEKLLNERNK